MKKTLEQLMEENRIAAATVRETQREIDAFSARETKEMECIVGQKIVDAKYYNEGIYVLTLENGAVLSFSASGDDATYVTMDMQDAPEPTE